jgi:hypothetical protein
MTPPRPLVAFLHLAVLSAFALAQPLFDLLRDNPEFFAARGSTAVDVIVFGLLLVTVPPALALAIELVAGLAGPRPRALAHLALLALLAATLFLQVLADLVGGSDALLIALALALGAGAATLYQRAEAVRSFLTVLSPAPVVFLVLFLFLSPVAKITLAEDAEAQQVEGVRPIPVVMVVFDELPLASLLDDRNRIDPQRYPGFAELAASATWFRNAHTVYDSTSKAVPAILDGAYPEDGSLPISSEHPDSIFTLLANSHAMNVSEAATTVCPRDICADPRLEAPLLDRLGSIGQDLGLVYAHVVSPPGIGSGLPAVSETWGDFGGEAMAAGRVPARNPLDALAALRGDRGGEFDAWLAAIRDGERPALHFKHVLLPHVPWHYLPSGQVYDDDAGDPIAGLSRQTYADELQMANLQLRHLLQLGFADLELRKLIAHLKRIGLYDRALVVVTADHGVAFQEGAFERRRATPDTLEEIASVPLLIKRPGQRRARVDDAIVATTDILPTIADVLDAPLPQSPDGRSAFGAAVERRAEVELLDRDFSRWIRLDRAELERRRRARVEEKVARFGTGADGFERIFGFGPHPGLLGRAPERIGVTEPSAARLALTDPGDYERVDPDGPFVPIWVTGRVEGGEGDRRAVAIALDGRVAVVTRSFSLANRDGELVAAFVPPSALRPGRNRVDAYEVVGHGEGLRLARMGGT